MVHVVTTTAEAALTEIQRICERRIEGVIDDGQFVGDVFDVFFRSGRISVTHDNLAEAENDP